MSVNKKSAKCSSVSSRLQNLKNPLQITSSRVKQLVQKLASTLANRYENWCVTNFAGTNTKKLDPLRLKLERYILFLESLQISVYMSVDSKSKKFASNMYLLLRQIT